MDLPPPRAPEATGYSRVWHILETDAERGAVA